MSRWAEITQRGNSIGSMIWTRLSPLTGRPFYPHWSPTGKGGAEQTGAAAPSAQTAEVWTGDPTCLGSSPQLPAGSPFYQIYAEKYQD